VERGAEAGYYRLTGFEPLFRNEPGFFYLKETGMAELIFITGGARSGKSRFAEQTALSFGAPLCYLATARALDAEMGERIAKHRQRRGDLWQTREEPLQPGRVLAENDGSYKATLMDCLTLWVTNLLLSSEDDDDVERLIVDQSLRLTETIAGLSAPVIIVSNEVGMGIVPDNRLARLFRDIAGQVNQIFAAAASEAWLVASGIPLRLK
jgi:adenosylcobinamide kinase / adenosylcobinamide-phosphate guanylyltransferase